MSHKKVWWQCSEGHEWQAFVFNRTKGWGCPQCALRKQTKLPDEQFIKYLNDGLNCREIAKQYDMSYRALHNKRWKLRKAGLLPPFEQTA